MMPWSGWQAPHVRAVEGVRQLYTGLPVITAGGAKPHTGSGISDEQENKEKEKEEGEGRRELVSKGQLPSSLVWQEVQGPRATSRVAGPSGPSLHPQKGPQQWQEMILWGEAAAVDWFL